MLQLTHARDRMVAPAEDYARFYRERGPSDVMRLWARYVEPPGKRSGRMLAFGDFSHDELIYDEEVFTAIGMGTSLASMGYLVTARLGHMVIGGLRAGRPELLPHHTMGSPRQWMPIWPAHGLRIWPSVPLTPVVQLGPLPVALRRA